MGSIFQGSPQTATSYTTTSTETPKWLQDAIFNQIQWAQNLANKPYEAYTQPRTADLTPQQTQAYANVTANQGAWSPALTAAQTGTQGLAGTTATTNIANYMNPYQQQVMDVMAAQAARNLQQNILPGIGDEFVRAGQFGGSRMGEFASRAVRDTQEALLNQQAQLAQQGYTQALGASQADLTRQQSALQQMAQQAQAGQQMRAADVAALEAAGIAQQQQAQRPLDIAYQDWVQMQAYPKAQMDWLSTQVRGLAPIVPTTQTQSGSSTGQTYSQSPLSQLASAGAAAAGLYNSGLLPR